MTQVSIIIPYFNGKQWLPVLLDSLMLQREYIERIVIVDDASSCTSIHEICQPYPLTEIHRHTQNLGFGKSCNIGVELARSYGAEFIMLLNQDTRALPGMIEQLLAVLEAKESVSVVAPISCDYHSDQIEDFFLRCYGERSSEFMRDMRQAGDLASFYEVEVMLAACMLIRTECVQTFGLFDPLYPMYCEDHDFCRRLTLCGVKIAFVPSARLSHYHSAAHTLSHRMGCLMFYSELIFELKNPGNSIAHNTIAMFSLAAHRCALAICTRNTRRLASHLASIGEILFSFHKILRSRYQERLLIQQCAVR